MNEMTAPAALDPAIVHRLAQEFLELTETARDRTGEDPFGNPVLSVALAITRRIDQGALTEAEIAALVRHLRDGAFADRARRLAAYVGGVDAAADEAAFAALAERLVRPDPDDSPVPFKQFRAEVERPRFAAVFTAHPTFALPLEVARALAEAASGRPLPAGFRSHRPPPITLQEEFAQAVAAIGNGRDALDRLTRALLVAARACWADRWVTLAPGPVILASWVGYDTDGRNDIGWWDTLRLRLSMKLLQLQRLAAQLAKVATASDLSARVGTALT